MVDWFKDINSVMELADFMVDSDQITDAKELLEYFKDPFKYNEVWEIYQEEIHGKIHKRNLDKTPLPVMLILASKYN